MALFPPTKVQGGQCGSKTMTLIPWSALVVEGCNVHENRLT